MRRTLASALARPSRIILITEDELVREIDRPRKRGECENGPRPCPFSSCKHHLSIDINESTGGLRRNFPDLEPEKFPETCALDVAERGGITLEETGEHMGLTRERVRQIEFGALRKLGIHLPAAGVDDD